MKLNVELCLGRFEMFEVWLSLFTCTVLRCDKQDVNIKTKHQMQSSRVWQSNQQRIAKKKKQNKNMPYDFAIIYSAL